MFQEVSHLIIYSLKYNNYYLATLTTYSTIMLNIKKKRKKKRKCLHSLPPLGGANYILKGYYQFSGICSEQRLCNVSLFAVQINDK